MRLLGEEELERSAVVANCRMNRERGLAGPNGYSRDLGFPPVEFLRERCALAGSACWLDLCCGSGRALIGAAREIGDRGIRVEVVGVDLVGMFAPAEPGLVGLRRIEASLSRWVPEGAFDLITCVHGLHYVGDKLGLIARAASWLADGGLFAANLDLANLKRAEGRASAKGFASDLRRAGLEYDPKRRIVRCEGRRRVDLGYRFLGADDGAGPNYTGQSAVDSWYERDPDTSRSGSA